FVLRIILQAMGTQGLIQFTIRTFERLKDREAGPVAGLPGVRGAAEKSRCGPQREQAVGDACDRGASRDNRNEAEDAEVHECSHCPCHVAACASSRNAAETRIKASRD